MNCLDVKLPPYFFLSVRFSQHKTVHFDFSTLTSLANAFTATPSHITSVSWKSYSLERLPSPPPNIGRLGYVTQLRFSSSEVRVIPQSCSATIGCFVNYPAEIRCFSSLLVFSRTTVLRHEARSLGSVSSSAEDRCSLFLFFFEIQNHGRARKRCALGRLFVTAPGAKD